MNSAPATKAVFCDVGGVLIADPWPLVSRQLSKEYCIDGTEVYAELVRLSKALNLSQIGILGLWKGISDALAIAIPYARFRRLILDDSLVRVIPVWNAVRSVRHCSVFALSNMSEPMWRSLQWKFGIKSLFDGEILSYKCGILKPDSRIFALALEKTRLKATESVFLDDSKANIATASSFGFRVYLASSPADTARFVAAIGAKP